MDPPSLIKRIAHVGELGDGRLVGTGRAAPRDGAFRGVRHADGGLHGRLEGCEDLLSARWFKPEVNINVISRRLGVPRKQLEKFRANYCKRCYQASSDFAKKHANCLVVNGWSISADLPIPIPISHACLCAVLNDGEVFVFDLVRDEPFYVWGGAQTGLRGGADRAGHVLRGGRARVRHRRPQLPSARRGRRTRVAGRVREVIIEVLLKYLQIKMHHLYAA